MLQQKYSAAANMLATHLYQGKLFAAHAHVKLHGQLSPDDHFWVSN